MKFYVIERGSLHWLSLAVGTMLACAPSRKGVPQPWFWQNVLTRWLVMNA